MNPFFTFVKLLLYYSVRTAIYPGPLPLVFTTFVQFLSLSLPSPFTVNFLPPAC